MKTRSDRLRIPGAATLAGSLLALTLIAPWGCAQDPDAAMITQLRRQAERGDPEAQYNLGITYFNHESFHWDEAEGAHWIRLAAEQGDPEAQRFLGLFYLTGAGVPQDEAEGVRWYRLAAEQGYAEAQYELGVTYELGDGAPQDSVLAHMWFSIASANGNESAGFNRDILESNMTPDEISRATELARECMASDYQDCEQ